jgi:hypothetical protein
MRISRIYVITWKHDYHLARLCISSIRYWYPDFPITLIKDEYGGNFDCLDLLKKWNVSLFETPSRHFSRGFGKLELFFQKRREKFLVLDADLVLLGPILDCFASSQADFIIDPEGEDNPAHIGEYAYRVETLKAFDPDFNPPNFMFNAGQFVGTSGILQRQDFDACLEWSEPRKLRHPEMILYAEQGLSNYVIFKAWQQKRLKLEQRKFYVWSGCDTSFVDVQALREKRGAAKVLHWAGAKPSRIEEFVRSDLLKFYRDYYDWVVGNKGLIFNV